MILETGMGKMSRILNRFKTYSGLTGFVFLIALLAFVFHYPIRILDALDSGPVSGFDIKISAWRMIFEPFIGPLLFYLRADQPFLEFTILLIWILSLSLIISSGKGLLKKNGRSINAVLHKFLACLQKLPLILSIWFGLLLFIIFIPLPVNTIVNNLENAILINTHSHSEYSHDGIISLAGLQEWHKRNGFDAFFITEHNHHEKTLEAVKAQEDGTLPPFPLILCGEEYSGSNHMTLLGLKRNFITRGLTDQQVIDSTHHDDGIVIVAHWFDGERKSIPYFLDLKVDGFEIANQGNGLKYDQRAFRNIVKACTANGLIMNGAADYHGYGSACFVWNALDIPGWQGMDNVQKQESILDILRRKDMGKIRVLVYNDRHVFDRSRVFLSPFYTFTGYFRTLNFLQIISWVIWLFLLRYAGQLLLPGNRFIISGAGALQVLETLALSGGFFILVLGIILLSRSGYLADYNDIYTEYGTVMVLVGTALLTYTIILMLLKIRSTVIKKRT